MKNVAQDPYRDYEERLLYTKDVIDPLQGFFNKCFISCCSKETISQLLRTIINLIGTEIEGEEISWGIVIQGPKTVKEKCAAIDKSHLKKRRIGSTDYESIRNALAYLQVNLGGFTPGFYREPIIVCDTRNLFVKKLIALPYVKNTIHTPHEAYIRLSEKYKCICLWIKPAAAVRLYKQGEFVGQIMRLRDAGGWAARNINDVFETVKFFSEESTILTKKTFSIPYFISPAIAMSEERKGSSIFVVGKEYWRELKKHSTCHHKFVKDLNLKNIKEAEFMTYLRHDGAIVLSDDGKLLSLGTYFIGPGGRKRIADDICKKWNAQAIVISQDGAIRFYSHNIEPNQSHDLKKTGDKMHYLRLDFQKKSTPELKI